MSSCSRHSSNRSERACFNSLYCITSRRTRTFSKNIDVEVHTPLASGLPGLQRFTVNRPSPDPGGNKAAYYLIAVLEFEDAGGFGAAVESDRGKATIADFDNFAQAGVTLLPGLAVSVAAGA